MRRIGDIATEEDARRFGDHLLATGVENEVEPEGESWIVWVVDDDDLDTARDKLESFRRNPSDPVYARSAAKAGEMRRQTEEEEKRWQKQQRNLRTGFARGPITRAPATIAFIVISVGVALLTRLGTESNDPAIGWLSFASYTEDGMRIRWYGLDDILSGQVWRIFTPMFIHYGFMHLLFNLFWLSDFGAQIESRKGTPFFLIMTLLIAGLSNALQYSVGGPGFGGMSGVVYGLFGYLWMKMRYQPEEGLGVAPSTVTILLVWLVVCMTGLLGPIANGAHIGGLVVGMAFGAAPTGWRRLRRRS